MKAGNPDVNRSRRIDSLDFLRGMAILWIVAVLHPQDYASAKYFTHRAFDVATAACLGIFVFISGYLLYKNNGYVNDPGGVQTYIKKRFLRIYPLYVLTLALFTLFSFISWKSLLVHSLFLNIPINKSMPTLWFVSMICCFYLFFPLAARNRSMSGTICLTGTLYLMFSIVHFTTNLIDIRLITYLPLFTFGMLSAKEDWVEGFFRQTSVRFLSLAASGLLAFAFLRTNDGSVMSLLLRTAFTVCAMPLMTALGAAGARATSRRLYARIACASFCMYLFHRIVFYLLIKAWNPGSDLLVVFYLLLAGLPLLYWISSLAQGRYDRLLAHISA